MKNYRINFTGEPYLPFAVVTDLSDDIPAGGVACTGMDITLGRNDCFYCTLTGATDEEYIVGRRLYTGMPWTAVWHLL